MRTFSDRLVPLLFGLLLAGCGSDAVERSDTTAEIPEAERYGGTVVLAGATDLQSMNVLATNETYSRMVQRELLFTPLVRYDESLEPVPWLAEHFDTVRVAPDTLELTFHLRRDVRWHDGTPTTAEDVKFTFERVLDTVLGSSLASSFGQYSPRAEVIDPYTVRFRLRPHPEPLDGWAQLAIMPAHLLRDIPAAELARHPFGTERPVGSGPFRFVRRTPGQEWVFEANPDFPAALGGRPYLDRVVYRVVPEQNTLVTELLTGAVDVVLGVGAEQTRRLGKGQAASLTSFPSPTWVFVAWNGRLSFFDTPEERRALTMALDRKGIVDGLLHGHGRVGHATVTPAHWAFQPSVSAVTRRDRVAARRLLAEVGWSDRDGDGLLEDAEGRPFRFTLKTPQGNDTRRDIAQVIQAELGALGIEVHLLEVEGNSLIGQVVGRDFEAVVMGWDDAFRKDDAPLFHSRNLDGPFQIAGYSSPRADRLLDTLALEADRERARPLWREYQEVMAEEVPFTVLYYPDRLMGVSRRVRGVTGDARGELTTLARWWLSPERRGPGSSLPK